MNKNIFKLGFSVCMFGLVACSQQSNKQVSSLPETKTLTKEVLMDKIKGGWAGQTIGVTYGGPTEFKFNGTYIQDYVKMPWYDGYIKWWYDNLPGLYDDIYMDLTFVDVFDRLGLEAPADSFATAFAYAGYDLWHANQAARYNIMHGIMPPESGHWINNPHANDIDYQIEADFAGLMSPGMPNAASTISDKIGHIMNYGDGWYGGVYVGAMYTLAFVSDDINFIVEEALKTIPKESRYYQCMTDIIRWHKQYPNDWKQTWFECQKKWSEEVGCPSSAFSSFKIDAIVNSAYILIGLLYGEGDFYKTMDISTRCGQDSDCNPASAAGILGTMLGYSNIPEYWMKNVREVEDMNFAYTNISLNKTYQMSFNQALQMIERNGGKVTENDVIITCQKPEPVRLEVSFEGLYPIENRVMNKDLDLVDKVEIEGTGAVFKGRVKDAPKDYIATVEVYMDGNLIETAQLPSVANTKTYRVDLFWKYPIEKGKHVFTFKWTNPIPKAEVVLSSVLIYSDAPVSPHHIY